MINDPEFYQKSVDKWDREFFDVKVPYRGDRKY